MSVAEAPRATEVETAFIRQAHQIVKDLMPPRSWIYWLDFTVSATIGYAALYLYLTAPMWSVAQAAWLVVAGFMIYRASIFTHELSHLPPTRFRVFRAVWNTTFGVPFLNPSFLYTDHRVHHTNQTYGTPGDAEYYPFGRGPLGLLMRNAVTLPLVPFLPLARFGLLGPLSLLHPGLRRIVWQRTSSLGNLSPAYRRAEPEDHERVGIWFMEAGCFVVAAFLIAGPMFGVISWGTFWKLYVLYLFVMIVNALRVYAAHHYVGGAEPMTFVEQMLDSTTIEGGPWSALWAPLGMRFHALHHLFPTMPYHAMGAAHRRLMRTLPPGSPYHATLRPSLWAAIAELVRSARTTSASPRAEASGQALA